MAAIESHGFLKTITSQVIAAWMVVTNTRSLNPSPHIPMPITTVLAALAGALFIAFLTFSMRRSGTPYRRSWMFPAALSLAFLVFSAYTAWTEGPTAFWAEHTRHLWGNQIWFDLLLGVSIGWFLIVPQAKALGMRLPVWLVLVVSTGNIGFMAMLARMLWLRERSTTKV